MRLIIESSDESEKMNYSTDITDNQLTKLDNSDIL